MNYVLDVHKCALIGNLWSSNGADPVYGFEYGQKSFAVYMSYVGAPGCVADMEDTQHDSGHFDIALELVLYVAGK